MSRTPDAGVRRTERIEVRATEAERAEIDAACQAAGRTRSDVLRELGLAWARTEQRLAKKLARQIVRLAQRRQTSGSRPDGS